MLCYLAQIAQRVVAHSQSQADGQISVVELFVVRKIAVQHIVVKRIAVLCTDECRLVVGNLADRLFV